MNLTKEQAMDLAKHYSLLSVGVAKYRYDNWDTLSEAKRKELSDQHWSLANNSDDFIILSSTLIMEDAQRDLQKIKTITEQIAKAIEKIKLVQKVIDIMAAALELGGAIIAKDPLLILKKIKTLETEIGIKPAIKNTSSKRLNT